MLVEPFAPTLFLPAFTLVDDDDWPDAPALTCLDDVLALAEPLADVELLALAECAACLV